MKLPFAARAVVDPEKVRDYLLSRSHPVGVEKARVFESLGYTRVGWRRLQHDLYMSAQEEAAEHVGETRYGRKYQILTILRGPNGRSIALTTIWIVLRDEEFPRLVTAYPDLP
jgi:hypothetical protein